MGSLTPDPTPEKPAAPPCEGVTCDGHGTCAAVSGVAVCACAAGFHNPSATEQNKCVVNDPACGDGTLNPGEICDLGASNITGVRGASGQCTTACQKATFCGDGTPDAGVEACDLGASNIVASRGQPGECTQSCTHATYCGDGVTDAGLEDCDNGASNVAPGMGTAGQCTTACVLLVDECLSGAAICSSLKSCVDEEVAYSCACPALFASVGASCDLARDGFDVQGHRGRFGTVPPGNTLVGYQAGILVGADTLEGDMRLSVDQIVIMSHDADLDAACVWAGTGAVPASRTISVLTSAEISQFDCHSAIAGIQPTATLSSLLALNAESNIGFSVEMKTSDVDAYLTAITSFNTSCSGCLSNRVIVQSFTHSDLDYAKQTYDNQVAYGNFRFRSAALGGSAASLASKVSYVDIWSPAHAALRYNDVYTAHQLGISVVPWTVDAQADIERMLDLGVDGIISNFPELVISVRNAYVPGAVLPIGLVGNLLQNPGAERQPVTAHGWTQVGGDWTVARGTDAANIGSYAGVNFFWPGQSASGELFQDVDLSANLQWLNQSAREVVFVGYVASWGGDLDTAQITVEARDVTNTVLGSVSSVAASPDVWTRVELRLPVPAMTTYVRVRLRGVRVQGSDNNGYFDELGLYMNALANPGAELQPVTANGWTVLGGDWSSSGASGPTGPQAGADYFWAAQSATGALYQDIDLSAYASLIADGTQTVNVIGFVGGAVADLDQASATVSALDANDAVLGSSTFPATSVDSWTRFELALRLPAATKKVRLELQATLIDGVNNDGYFDGLALFFPDPLMHLPMTNSGAEVQPVTTNGWTQLSGDWSIARGTDAGGVGTHGGTNFFWAGQTASGELYQDVVLPRGKYQSVGGRRVYTEGFVASWSGDNDSSQVIFECRTPADVVVSSITSPVTNVSVWTPLGGDTEVLGGASKVRARLLATRVDFTDNNGYFDDVSIHAPETNLLDNPGAEAQPVTNNGWTALSGDWTIARGNDDGGIGTHSGANFFWAGQSSSGELYQDVSLTSYSGVIGGGTQVAVLTAHVGSWSGDADSVRIGLAAYDVSNALIGTVETTDDSPDTWTSKEIVYVLPAATRSVRVRLIATRNAGSDNNGYIDDVALFLP